MKKKLMLGLLAFALLLTGCGKQVDGTIRITNVSYDPTREFYEAYNQMFEYIRPSSSFGSGFKRARIRLHIISSKT